MQNEYRLNQLISNNFHGTILRTPLQMGQSFLPAIEGTWHTMLTHQYDDGEICKLGGADVTATTMDL